jgi:hypothetical protein
MEDVEIKVGQMWEGVGENPITVIGVYESYVWLRSEHGNCITLHKDYLHENSTLKAPELVRFFEDIHVGVIHALADDGSNWVWDDYDSTWFTEEDDDTWTPEQFHAADGFIELIEQEQEELGYVDVLVYESEGDLTYGAGCYALTHAPNNSKFSGYVHNGGYISDQPRLHEGDNTPALIPTHVRFAR